MSSSTKSFIPPMYLPRSSSMLSYSKSLIFNFLPILASVSLSSSRTSITLIVPSLTNQCTAKESLFLLLGRISASPTNAGPPSSSSLFTSSFFAFRKLGCVQARFTTRPFFGAGVSPSSPRRPREVRIASTRASRLRVFSSSIFPSARVSKNRSRGGREAGRGHELGTLRKSSTFKLRSTFMCSFFTSETTAVTTWPTCICSSAASTCSSAILRKWINASMFPSSFT
mmetsp:Transcript_10804/g.20605  ORF Transcript_10804/g.20605 Transcript_10804/m.20605 type:complete len:227 (+) Transcript_10804:807-1487(+)